MPNATPPTSCPSMSAGLTARPTSAPTTTRRRLGRPVASSTSSTTPTAQPAYVTLATLNDAPAARRPRAASSARLTLLPSALTTPRAYRTVAAADAPRRQQALLGARAVVVEPAQQLLEERREVARVVDGGGAEGGRTRVVRHLVGADQVAAPELGGVEPEPRGGEVEQPLAGEVALRAAGRAQRADGRLVRHHAPQVARVRRHAVRPRQEGGAERGGHERRGAHVRAE